MAQGTPSAILPLTFSAWLRECFSDGQSALVESRKEHAVFEMKNTCPFAQVVRFAFERIERVLFNSRCKCFSGGPSTLNATLQRTVFHLKQAFPFSDGHASAIVLNYLGGDF